jgi:hypothetical protein
VAVEETVTATAIEKPRSDAEKERITALAKVPMGARGVMLQGLNDLKEFAETAVKSGSAPKNMNTGQAMMAIQAGLERGLGPLGGLQACVVINGVLSWRGWAAKGLIQQSGLLVPGTLRTWHEGNLDGPKADAVGYASAQRKGYAKPFVRSFSVKDARKAGLWTKTGPWTTRPGNMLEWRAIGDMARFEFPEILGGIPIADEVEGGYGPPDVEIESPKERAHRPAPKLQDPLLGEIDEGDTTGVQAAETEEERQKALEKAAEEEREEEAPDRPDSVPGPAGDTSGQETADQTPAPAPEEKPTTVVIEGTSGNVAKVDPCPRCGEADGGFAMFGECGVCRYPEPEPGAPKE